MTELVLLAQQNSEWGKAAPIGLFVLLVFFVVSFFLFRSMNRHLRKVPPTFTRKGTAATEEPLGASSTAFPTVEYRDPKQQTPPRLGSPEDYAKLSPKDERKQQVRDAKARRKQRARAGDGSAEAGIGSADSRDHGDSGDSSGGGSSGDGGGGGGGD